MNQIQATPAEKQPSLGNDAKGAGNVPAASPAAAKTGDQGNQQGTVTITVEELRNLKRHEARSLSFERRKNFNVSRNNPSLMTDVDPNADPDLIERIRVEQEGRTNAERRALRAEVSSKVSELLNKDEFKSLPQSTKNLILKNPHMLSEADNLEEALLDIEDFVREQIIAESAIVNTEIKNKGDNNPPGHETPVKVGSGIPAPVNAEGLEDLSKLTGASRSRATLRNAMKKAKGIQG